MPLFALLLFNAPEVFTLRTLLALDGLGERRNQLRAGDKQALSVTSRGARFAGVPLGVAAHEPRDEFFL